MKTKIIKEHNLNINEVSALFNEELVGNIKIIENKMFAIDDWRVSYEITLDTTKFKEEKLKVWIDYKNKNGGKHE